MQLLFTSPDLTGPTADTLKEYGTRRFTRLAKYMPALTGDYHIRVSVHKERHLFVIMVEMGVPKPLVVRVKGDDLRRVIDQAYEVMRTNVTRSKEKYSL